MLTCQQSVFKQHHSNRFLSVLPTRWRRKTAGIDTKQNYVTVTLRIPGTPLAGIRLRRSFGAVWSPFLQTTTGALWKRVILGGSRSMTQSRVSWLPR